MPCTICYDTHMYVYTPRGLLCRVHLPFASRAALQRTPASRVRLASSTFRIPRYARVQASPGATDTSRFENIYCLHTWSFGNAPRYRIFHTYLRPSALESGRLLPFCFMNRIEPHDRLSPPCAIPHSKLSVLGTGSRSYAQWDVGADRRCCKVVRTRVWIESRVIPRPRAPVPSRAEAQDRLVSSTTCIHLQVSLAACPLSSPPATASAPDRISRPPTHAHYTAPGPPRFLPPAQRRVQLRTPARQSAERVERPGPAAAVRACACMRAYGCR